MAEGVRGGEGGIGSRQEEIVLKQWRIQDFPEWGANSQSGCANLLFCKFFVENCMRMKEFGPRGGPRTWRPLGSANVKCLDVAAFWRPSSAIRAPGRGNVHLTRMHSSRMRTARFRGCLPGAVCPVGCVHLGGVCLGGVHPSPLCEQNDRQL